MSRPLLLALALAGLGGCVTSHSVHVDPVEVAPIHVRMDVNVRLQDEAGAGAADAAPERAAPEREASSGGAEPSER